jgi:hypothetical protein
MAMVATDIAFDEFSAVTATELGHRSATTLFAVRTVLVAEVTRRHKLGGLPECVSTAPSTVVDRANRFICITEI